MGIGIFDLQHPCVRFLFDNLLELIEQNFLQGSRVQSVEILNIVRDPFLVLTEAMVKT